MSTCTLDVLIPHFNDADGLKRSVESVETQDWRGEKRLIIVDDGSDANTLKSVKNILKATSLASVLIEHSENLGRPFARNTALRASEAPYISWLDAGDLWYSNKIGHQIRYLRRLEDEGRDISRIWVSCHYDWEQDGKSRLVLQNSDATILQDLLLGDRFRAYLWTLLGRREAFVAAGFFDEKLPRMQDLDYFIRFVRGGGEIAIPDRRIGLCRYFKSDIGRNHKSVAHSAQRIFDKNRSVIDSLGIAPRIQWKNAQISARFARNNGNYLSAMGYFTKTAAQNPKYALYRLKKGVFQ